MTENFLKHLDKARRYCDYQDRCIADVKEKMRVSDATNEEISRIITILLEESLLNEQRFAASFARGKLRSNLWGKNKIRMALQMKRIDKTTILQALEKLDETEYLERLQYIISHYKPKGANLAIRKMKTARYAIQKGFESDLVWRALKSEE
jgi:regulatory protein